MRGVDDYHFTQCALYSGSDRVMDFRRSILPRLATWFGSVTGKVVACIILLAIVVLVWKGQSIYDAARAKWWGTKSDSAEVHVKSGDSLLQSGKKDSAASAAAFITFDGLFKEPEIKTNPGALRVGTAARKVIASKDKEITTAKASAQEFKKAAETYQAAGEKPEPRVQKYIDFGYTRSLVKNYGVPVVRAGATYRIAGWMRVQGEVSYEPPPAISPERAAKLDMIQERDYARPEIRATITAHIKF